MNDNNAAHTPPVNSNIVSLNEEEKARDITASPSPSPQQGRQHILIVEDDATLAELEAEILTVHGYTVVTVQSGELAISTFRHSIPDLVVLDLELTGSIHGWDVLQALRARAITPVLITSSSVTAVRPYMRSRGETRLTLDHLPKPYSLQTLLKRIKRMLPIAPQ